MVENLKVIDVFRFSFGLLNRKDQKIIILLSIVSFIGSFIELAAVMSILPFVSLLYNPELIQKNQFLNFIWIFFNEPNYQKFLLILAILISFFLIFSAVLVYFIQFTSNRFAGKCQESYGIKLFNSLLGVNYEWHIRQNPTLLMTIFISHISIWNRGLIRQIPLLVSNLTLILLPSISLILISPRYGVILIFLGIILVSIFLRFIRKKSDYLSRKAKTSQEEVSVYINEILQAIKDVKLSSNSKIFVKKFKSIYHIFSMYLSKASSWNMLPTSVIILFSQLSILSIGTFLVAIGVSPENIISIMTVVILFASKVIPSLNRIGATLTAISNKRSWIKTLNDIYIDTRERQEFKTELDIKKFNWSKVSFKDVSYEYPLAARKALKNINLNLYSGYHYGFVGESGSGKSTLIDLFLGLLSPSDGLITVDGKELNNLGVENWQFNIGYVPQKPLIINVTLKENIAFGTNPQLIDEERINECIKLAALEDLVESLPNGINSDLGDRGKYLSGGQEQRVAIARALYQRPNVLIFDESTSFQDSKNENLIRKSINNLKGEITILSISHKFSFIKNCDRVFVLKKGELVEQFNYQEFLKESKYYKESTNYLEDID
ncbi:MAG: hypothetical protein CMK49_01040 [Prochlorococcus sp. SP3034]|nr:hypothetical protein [Prochlorococcus sp. SP3034]|tara:strand:+ start:14400 stop:16220 length:1821 start_codon:yes stop_codon:yes gene_type:complete